MNILIVTLVLQRTMRDYAPARAYIDSFDWRYACAPTATTHVMLLRTDTPEQEIEQRLRSHIDATDDFCHVDCYDTTEGPRQLLDAADSLRQWLQ
jgi:hypothetical protein